MGTSLTVSFIGMKDKEVVAKRNMTVTLDDNVKMLDDLVVVGYGVMKKKDLTGSIASVGATDIANAHATNLSTALQGAAAGLTVTRDNGTPDGKPPLLVRGVTTISDTRCSFGGHLWFARGSRRYTYHHQKGKKQRDKHELFV